MDIFYASYTTVDVEPREILDRVEGAGFDGFEILSEGLHDLRNRDVVAKFLDADTSLGLTVHAPISDMNFATLNEELREVVVRQSRAVVMAAAEVGAERVTLHPGHRSPIGRRYPEVAWEKNLQSLREVAAAGEDAGISVGVENLAGVEVFLGRTPGDLFSMADGAGLEVTLDVGHAFIEGELDGFLDRGDRIDHVHVHDNDGEGDQHLAVLDGSIPFERAGNLFEKEGIIFVIEGRSLEDGRRSLNRIRDLAGAP
ncbi:MAG: hypothetical protein MAG715_01070 [Methanonatronarchaeales archaeon]|nr:hypothetical protein [Methanonatronarchaeales archaeon]